MDDLVTWLRAQLDDDERKVAAMEREERRVRTAPIFQGHPPNWLAGVDIFVSSARWRAEVDAKRRILDRYEDANAEVRSFVTADQRAAARVAQFALESVVQALALPYAGRPGYLPDWRSDGS